MPANAFNRGVSPWFGRAFGLVLFFSALTGFAQMPIFKRYYIADIPGLGWLANYYATFTLHHISAALFLFLAVFALTDFLLRGRYSLTTAGAIKGGLLAAIAVTGGLLVTRNLPGYRFSPNAVIVMDMSHLGLVMAFLFTAAVTAFSRKRWRASKLPAHQSPSDQ